jgi:hypothetical protein
LVAIRAIVQRKQNPVAELRPLDAHAACRARPEVSLLNQKKGFIGLCAA